MAGRGPMGRGGAAGMMPGTPNEAELRAMVAEMRQAPAEQVVVEVVNVLLQAVQVKLGRPDARLLIDIAAAVADTATGRLDASLVDQVQRALAQLRLAQVEAEAPGSAAPDGPAVAAGEDPPPGSVPATPGGDGSRSARAMTGGTPSAVGADPRQAGASRLWVPGR
jgi:hypothetical protein